MAQGVVGSVADKPGTALALSGRAGRPGPGPVPVQLSDWAGAGAASRPGGVVGVVGSSAWAVRGLVEGERVGVGE